MRMPLRPSCCLKESNASVKCCLSFALKVAKIEGVSTYWPKDARNCPSGKFFVLRCSRAYTTVGFSTIRESGHKAGLSPKPSRSPKGRGKGEGGSRQQYAPAAWSSSPRSTCIEATEQLPSKAARSWAMQPRPSGAVDRQRWSPQTRRNGSPSTTGSQSKIASRMPVGRSCFTNLIRAPILNNSSSYAAASNGTLSNTTVSSRLQKTCCICAWVAAFTTMTICSMSACINSSHNQHIAGFTRSPMRIGNSHGPMHFVAGHMPGHMPAIGITAERTDFCAGMVSNKGSMPRVRTISTTDAWATASLHTNCALPSPWEPTPLPPVMCGRSSAQPRSRCSVGAANSWGQRGTALASHRAWASDIKAPMRSAALAGSLSRDKISTACAQTSKFTSPSKACNALSRSSRGKG
mmetsp:Transcript_28963/g.83062  ORF Transcript_28963/g.83062 Transcript_28963/m.83062 type:complete len:407 (-) Transcript_28963:715-1935(-)